MCTGVEAGAAAGGCGAAAAAGEVVLSDVAIAAGTEVGLSAGILESATALETGIGGWTAAEAGGLGLAELEAGTLGAEALGAGLGEAGLAGIGEAGLAGLGDIAAGGAIDLGLGGLGELGALEAFGGMDPAMLGLDQAVGLGAGQTPIDLATAGSAVSQGGINNPSLLFGGGGAPVTAPVANGGIGLSSGAATPSFWGSGTSIANTAGTSGVSGFSTPSSGFWAGATPGAAPGGLQGMFGSLNKFLSPIGGLTGLQLGAGLYGLYGSHQMAKKQEAMYNSQMNAINNMYAPGSPEWKLMKQEMDRKDAAAGRNSQYGPRATEMAGRIAEAKLRARTGAATGLASTYNSALQNKYSGLNGIITLMADAERRGR